MNGFFLGSYYWAFNPNTPVAHYLDSANDVIDSMFPPCVRQTFCTNWMARWVGYVTPPASGYYTLYTSSDDGHRFYVNRQLVLSAWFPQTFGDYWQTTTIPLIGGRPTQIAIEFNQGSGGQGFVVQWESAELGIVRQNIPSSLVRSFMTQHFPFFFLLTS